MTRGGSVAEQRIHNPFEGGSIPPPPATNLPDRRNGGFCRPLAGRAFFFRGLVASTCPANLI